METLAFSAIACAASLFGILLAMRWQQWTIDNSHIVNSVAAGVILGVAFLRLIPETYEINAGALPFILVGFLALYLVETVAVFHGGVEIHYEGVHEHVHSPRGWGVFTGLFLHSLIDGVVIGVGFEISEKLGIVAASGVILHKLPEGAAVFSLLISRIRRRPASLLSGAVALAAPVGSVVGMLAFRGMERANLGYLLALAAGSFLYIGASDLVPETHTAHARRNAMFLLLGVGLAYGLTRVLGMH